MSEKIIKKQINIVDPVVGLDVSVINPEVFDHLTKLNNEIITGLSKDLLISLPSLNISENILKSYTENFKNMISNLQDFSSLNKNITQLYENYIKDIEKIQNDPEYKKLPFYFAGFFPYHYWIKIKNLWLDEKKEEAMELTYDFTIKKELMEELKNDLLKNQYFLDNEQCLNEALEAHSQGKFYLSVPILYSLLDGYLISVYKDFYKEKIKQHKYSACENCNNPIDKCPYCGVKLKELRPIDPNAKRITNLLMNSQDEDIYEDNLFSFINEDYGPRSAIMHGLDFSDCNFMKSTTLVLVLSNIIEIKKEGVIHA